MSVFDFSGVKLTHHARQVMRDRSIDIESLVEVVREPQIVEPHAGNWRFVRGDLCAVVAVSKGAALIITVLLRRGDQWTDEDARRRQQ